MYVACAHIACAHPFRFPGVCCCFSEFLVGSASLRFPEVLRSLVSAATYGWEFPTVVLVPESQLNSQPRSLPRRLKTASELHRWTKYWITSWCFNSAPKAASLPCYLQCGDFGWFCSWAGKGRLCSLTRPGCCCRWWQSIYSVLLTDCQSSDMVLYYLFLWGGGIGWDSLAAFWKVIWHAGLLEILQDLHFQAFRVYSCAPW